MFAVCACARFQVNPKSLHLQAVKRIFIYLKGQPKLDLWYPKDSLFDLVAYTDSDYAGACLDRKSTTGGCQFLGCALDPKSIGCLEWNERAAKDEIGVIAFLEKPTESEGFEEIVDFLNANPIKYALTVNPTIYCSCIKQFWDTIKAKMVNGEVQMQALVDKKKKKQPRRKQEKDTEAEMAEESSSKRAKGIVFYEQEQAPTPIVSSQQPTQVKDKGKGKMVEEEPVKKMSKKELLKLNEELAFKLQAEEEEQARLAKEKAEKVKEANIS
ncbi:hypothetical protein Tco_1414083 [Tanacetum coccineum]